MHFFTRTTVLTALMSCASAVYPTDHPFENDVVPLPVPNREPSFKFDSDDPGGYVYHGLFTLEMLFGGTITDADFPYSPHLTGYSMYLLVDTYGTPPALAPSIWNCSAKSHPLFQPSDFSGVSGKYTVCNVGECCSHLYGYPKFSDDVAVWESGSNDRLVAGLCPEMSERLYCIAAGSNSQINCYEYMTSTTERVYIFACYDNIVNFALTCPLYRTAYSTSMIWETPTYYSSVTNEENLSVDAFCTLPDRVCHPYSYYHGNAVSSAEGTSESDKVDSPASTLAVIALLFGVFLL